VLSHEENLDMKQLLLSVLVSSALWQSGAMAAPVPTYTNPTFGLVTTPPMIDAVNFINYGEFSIAVPTLQPFETFDTRNYTNYGVMFSDPGWRFDLNSNATGRRGMASSFVNFNPGIIQSFDVPNNSIPTISLS
jgi:hypothetical protein